MGGGYVRVRGGVLVSLTERGSGVCWEGTGEEGGGRTRRGGCRMMLVCVQGRGEEGAGVSWEVNTGGREGVG